MSQSLVTQCIYLTYFKPCNVPSSLIAFLSILPIYSQTYYVY